MNLLLTTLFVIINIAVSALIFYLWEIDSDVLNFIVCCLFIGFDGAVLDRAVEHGKSKAEKRGW